MTFDRYEGCAKIQNEERAHYTRFSSRNAVREAESEGREGVPVYHLS